MYLGRFRSYPKVALFGVKLKVQFWCQIEGTVYFIMIKEIASIFLYNYFLFFHKNQELFCDAQLFLIFRKGAIKLSNQIKSNICPEQALSVRLCVYVCVCVSVTAFHFNTIRPILIKLRPIDLIKYLR